MSKGGNFENEVAIKLSLWFSDNKSDNIFCRTHGSGSKATFRNKKGKDVHNLEGDIGYVHPSGKPLIDSFFFSLKTGYSRKTKIKNGIKQTNWCILDILDSHQSLPIILEFWEEVTNKANNKIPILIFRRNNRKICICFNEKLFSKLIEKYDCPKTEYIFLYSEKYGGLIFMLLDNFLKWIKIGNMFPQFITNI